MARQKPTPIDHPADGTLSPAITGDDARAAIHEVETIVDVLGQMFTQPVEVAPTRTRDRDPADREAWKRQRAAALGIPRD